MRLRPIQKLRDQDRYAIHLLVLRYPWDVIKTKSGVKQQTIKKKLRVIYKAGLFDELKDCLVKEFFQLDESDFDNLQKDLEADASGEAAFRRSGQIVGKEFRTLANENAE